MKNLTRLFNSPSVRPSFFLYRYIIVAVAAQNIRIYQNKRTIIMYSDTE